MEQNLHQSTNYNDLVTILKNHENKFIVLVVVINETSEQIRNMLKKFIEEKAKLYHKVMFFFYEAQECDLGKLIPILSTDLTDYPKLFHLYGREILSNTIRIGINDHKFLDGSFGGELFGGELHEAYLKGSVGESGQRRQRVDE